MDRSMHVELELFDSGVLIELGSQLMIRFQDLGIDVVTVVIEIGLE